MMRISRFSITYLRQVVGGLALSACLSLLAASEALASFSFTKIADTRSNFTSVSPGAAINDSGTVAFFATPSAGNQGIYTSRGGAITEIANTGNLPSPFSAFGGLPGLDPSVLNPTVNINNNGTVAFSVRGAQGPTAYTGVLTSLGGSITTRATGSLSGSGNGNIIQGFDLNNNEELAYLTVNQGGPSITNFSYTLAISRPSQPDVTVATAFFEGLSPYTTGDLSTIGDFAINNRNKVTFEARKSADNSFLGAISEAIYRGNGGPLTSLFDTGTQFTNLFDTNTSKLSVNDKGDVVLSNNNALRLFKKHSGTLTTIADSTGAFKTFNNAAINNSDTVTFGADLAAGGKGIFVGPDAVGDKVIATGDRLNGSTVTNLSFSKKGLNNHGQIAFYAELTDGTRGIFLADKEPGDIGS